MLVQSTECYRDFWPAPFMRSLLARSIDLMDDLHASDPQTFAMSRRGYLYLIGNGGLGLSGAASQHEQQEALMQHPLVLQARSVEQEARTRDQGTSSVDVLVGSGAVREAFPWAGPDVCGAVHARRCGWVNAQQMGQAMLNAAKHLGASVLRGSLSMVETDGSGRVQGVAVARGCDGGGSGDLYRIRCGSVVNAAGPLAQQLHRKAFAAATTAERLADAPSHASVESVYNETHAKVVFHDTLRVIPDAAPMVIWDDAQQLAWEPDEAAALHEAAEAGEAWARKLLVELPGGVHLRPYGNDRVLMLWECWHSDAEVTDPPAFPPSLDTATYPEVCLRGLLPAVPALEQYLGGPYGASIPPSTFVDGGYYTRTPQNVPLIGPVLHDAGISGMFICAGLSGFGIMASNGAGDLLAAAIDGNTDLLPWYAPYFHPGLRRRADVATEIERYAGAGQI